MSQRSAFQKIGPAVIGNAVALMVLAGLGLFFFQITEGDWWLADPGQQRWTLAAAVISGYIALCLGIAFRSHRRGRTDRLSASHSLLPSEQAVAGRESAILIAYASQTGFAQELARRTMELLHKSGQLAHMAALHQIDHQRLSQGGPVLFVASTTGQGDPPDHALAFVREVMPQSAVFDSLQFGILALGDRQYEQFCAFGRQLDQWLRQRNARPLFDMIEVDNADAESLGRWQSQVQQLGLLEKVKETSPDNVLPSVKPFEIAAQKFDLWQLQQRLHLNPGSQGGQAYSLTFTPPADVLLDWTAGDIAEILPQNPPQTVAAFLQAIHQQAETLVHAVGRETTWGELVKKSQLPSLQDIAGLSAPQIAHALRPLKPRQYSIASLPVEGTLQLLVRRVELAEGQLGVGSGWLCEYAPLNEEIELRIRSNPNFHPGDPARPMILIGNGTGIAGLRGHLKARMNAKAPQNWLLFGERNAHCDHFFREEMERWQAAGGLDSLDLAFSRDQAEAIYVQHKLQQSAGKLQQWIADGAQVYVCGSLIGMAPAVDAVLREVLGSSQVDQLLAEGRYRRDVY